MKRIIFSVVSSIMLVTSMAAAYIDDTGTPDAWGSYVAPLPSDPAGQTLLVRFGKDSNAKYMYGKITFDADDGVVAACHYNTVKPHDCAPSIDLAQFYTFNDDPLLTYNNKFAFNPDFPDYATLGNF